MKKAKILKYLYRFGIDVSPTICVTGVLGIRSHTSNQTWGKKTQHTFQTLLKNDPIVSLFSATASSLLNPIPKGQVLDSSKLKEFADDNFEFDENGGKFSERVENAVGKGEIACC